MNRTEQMLERIAVALEKIARIVERAYWDEHPEADASDIRAMFARRPMRRRRGDALETIGWWVLWFVAATVLALAVHHEVASCTGR